MVIYLSICLFAYLLHDEFISDFDEIKQDISSFRYEMLNHISVRQMETMENKDRLDRLYGKIDAVLLQQKQLVRIVSSGVTSADDSSKLAPTDSVSSCSDSTRSTSTVASSVSEDDDETTMADMQRFKKATASIKSMKKIPEERSKTEADEPKLSPKRGPSKREESLKRQNVVGSITEDDPAMTEAVAARDIKVHVITSKTHQQTKDEHL